MNYEKFSALLSVLTPSVVQLVVDNKKITNIEATKMFYNSELYAMLENEKSKLWHLSPETLYELFEEELVTGNINYPEEV